MPFNQVGYYQGPQGYRASANIRNARLAYNMARQAGKYARQKYDEYMASKAKPAATGRRGRGRPRGSGRGGGTTPRVYGNQVPARLRYRGATNTPATAKMGWSTGQSLNRVKKPAKGGFGPKGVVVVNKKKGKQLYRQKKRFDQSTYTTAFIGSTPNLDAAGNMGKLDERYTFPSHDSQHCTGWVYNVGGVSNYWNPMEKGKIGNQTILATDTAHNNFYLINQDNSDVEHLDYMIKQQKLPETSTPFNTGELPVTHIYRTPNTILASVDLNLKFTAASVQDNLITIQVVRATAPIPIVPGNLGHDETESPFSNDRAKFMLTNSINKCNGHYLQILYTKTFLLKGVNLNAKHPATKYIRKKVKMNYLRSTCRRESSAAIDDLDYKLGGEWKASFSIDESGAMFNNVYVKVLSRAVTKTAKANMQVGENDGALGTVSKAYTVPTFHNMDSSTGPFEYTSMKNARFRYAGSIGISSYCAEISRSFGNSEMSAISTLNSNIQQLQDQVNELQTLANDHDDSDCTSCEESDHDDGSVDDGTDDEDCGSGHQAGASPPGDGHTHPNSLTAEEHDANCQHSH